MESMKCPSCGSPDLRKISLNEFVCENCHTTSKFSEDKKYLIIQKGFQCPSCGFFNDDDVRFCGECGNPILKRCLQCDTEVKINLKYCPNCGNTLFNEKLNNLMGYYDIIIKPGPDYPNKKIDVIKEIRNLTNLDLVSAKNMCEKESVFATHLPKDEALIIKDKFESLGAIIEILPASHDRQISHFMPDKKEKDKCYIATAVMGDISHPYVETLRAYRDLTLSKNIIGKYFINIYYHISPFFAGIIQGSPFLKHLTKKLLIKPMYSFALHALKNQNK
jgi:RNA polymerase subunit RPABC4/transcription elongation factor Spt4